MHFTADTRCNHRTSTLTINYRVASKSLTNFLQRGWDGFQLTLTGGMTSPITWQELLTKVSEFTTGVLNVTQTILGQPVLKIRRWKHVWEGSQKIPTALGSPKLAASTRYDNRKIILKITLTNQIFPSVEKKITPNSSYTISCFGHTNSKPLYVTSGSRCLIRNYREEGTYK
jgi:hypothetical protein